MPDVFWDGIIPLSQMILGQPNDEKLILSEENSTTFLTISPIKYMLGFSSPVRTDMKEFEGEIIPLEPISINSF